MRERTITVNGNRNRWLLFTNCLTLFYCGIFHFLATAHWLSEKLWLIRKVNHNCNNASVLFFFDYHLLKFDFIAFNIKKCTNHKILICMLVFSFIRFQETLWYCTLAIPLNTLYSIKVLWLIISLKKILIVIIKRMSLLKIFHPLFLH